MEKVGFVFVSFLLIAFYCFQLQALVAHASYHFSDYQGTPPIHTYGTGGKTPRGMTPAEIKSLYNLPATGGKGTIVIVGAYKDTSIEEDLGVFDKTFNLPPCTTKDGCLSEHDMGGNLKTNSGWAMETALDVEWAHAIAPNAKILLVEATTQSGANLLKAVDYAAAVKDASAISMSWGGGEFLEETGLDSHFSSVSSAPFFASSGDSGAGASWPASSPNVIAVGGTTLTSANEVAWKGSGGGVSAYEKAPDYQFSYGAPNSGGMRAMPDVAYDANPSTGFSVYSKGAWHTVGGTSAGAPQWAAIAALSKNTFTNADLYADAGSAKYFRDITSGSNGTCKYFCTARAKYDYVTGLGSPQTSNF